MSLDGHQKINWRSRIVKRGTILASQITPHPQNPRRHPQFQRDVVAGSFDELGQIAPIVINVNNGYLVDGEERSWLALAQEGDVEVEAVWVDLSEAEHLKALAYLDASGALAEYDGAVLDEIYGEIDTEDESLQQLLRELKVEANYPQEEKPDPGAQVNRADELQQKWQVQPGDLFEVGAHRVLCGDSTKAEDVARVMGGEKAQGVFTSPPYAEQRKKQYGGIPTEEYIEWWGILQSRSHEILLPDGSLFLNIKPHVEETERSLYVCDLVVAMVRRWSWMFIDEFCWLRAGVPKQVIHHFKNGFEPVYQFSLQKDFKFRPEAVMHESDSVPIPYGEGAGDTNWARWQGHGKFVPCGNASNMQGHVGNIFAAQKIEKGMAYPSNVLKGIHQDESFGHEATFPVGLPEFFIQAYSDEQDIWFDPFLGSGTTLVACEQLHRRGRGIEIHPPYVAVTLERLSLMGLEVKKANS